MKSFSSKLILEKVKKIEKKYTKPSLIQDDSEDEDLMLLEKDFTIGGKSNTWSHLQGKEVFQFISNDPLNKVNIQSPDLLKYGDKWDIHDTSLPLSEKISERHSDHKSDIKPSSQVKYFKKRDFFDTSPLHLQENYEISATVSASGSPLYENVNKLENLINFEDEDSKFYVGDLLNENISNDRLQMNINLKLRGEELDGFLSSVGKSESDVSEDLDNFHLNILPFEDLLNEDYLKGISSEVSKNDDPDYLPKTKDTDDNLSVKTSSVSFAEEMKSVLNSSVSLNKSHSSNKDKVSLFDSNHDDFNHLNIHIFNVEDLIESEKGEFNTEYNDEILSAECQLGIDNYYDYNSKLLSLDENEKKNETEGGKTFSVIKSTSLLSVHSVERDATDVTSSINEDIKENVESLDSEIIQDLPHFEAVNSVGSVVEDIEFHNISRKLPLADHKNISHIQFFQKDLQEAVNGNDENLPLTKNSCLKTVREMEEQDSIIEKSNHESTTINEDIEEDLDVDGEQKSSLSNSNFQHHILPIAISHHESPSSLIHNCQNRKFKEFEIYEQTFSKDDVLNSSKPLERGIKNKIHKVKMDHDRKPQNDIGSNRKHKQRGTDNFASKFPENDECIKKNVRDVSSQTNIAFLPDQNKEFEKKIEEILKTSFMNTPNLINYQFNAAEGVTSQDLFSPSERGFHWALKQQVELTRHFIQAEYNMYATCMTAIRELSADYKPISIKKFRKRKI